jgi:monoamine oxidase
MNRVLAGCASFIQTKLRIAIGSLGAALSIALASSAPAVEPSTDHDFVIVGAGASGLYAAYELDALGYDVLILEATGRHGGRVFSGTLGDVGIEHGAEELYGATNNFVFNDIKSLYGNGAHIEIFKESKAQDTLIQIDGTSTCLVSNDCDSDADIVDYWDFYYDTGNHDNDLTDVLVSDHMDTVLGVDSKHRAYHLYESGSPGGEYGTTVERIGLRSLSRQDNMWPLSGKVYGLDPTGYLDALNALYFDAVAPSKVSYNSPVTIIDTSGPKPVAIDSNGVYHYAKAILVTVSVGVLKAEIIDFVPDLSAAKVAAYTTIGMGRGLKISTRFSTQFWDPDVFSLLSEGPAGNCWDPGGYQPGTTDHVLTCFSMGNNAQALSDLPDDTARINQILSDLDAIFAGAATANYVEGQVQDWTNEPYVRGSYSYPAVGTYPGGTSMREELAMPVGSTLYFAGEATHNTAPSTVPGALQSGERAAAEMDTDEGAPPAAGTPSADFSANIVSGNAPLDVDFTDLSSQTPTGWSWTFGDTGTSPDQHASHQYTTPGTYSVSLTATNATGSHTRVLPNLIMVPEPVGVTQIAIGIVCLFVFDRCRGREKQRG